jgi:hypothetical protein
VPSFAERTSLHEGVAIEPSLRISELTKRLERRGVPFNREDKDRLSVLVRNYVVSHKNSGTDGDSVKAGDESSAVDPQISLPGLCAALEIPISTNQFGRVGMRARLYTVLC